MAADALLAQTLGSLGGEDLTEKAASPWWQFWWQFSSVHARPDMSTRVSHKPVTCRYVFRWTLVDRLSTIC